RRTVTELTVKPWHAREHSPDSSIIGRDAELKELSGYINKKVSVMLYGPKGCGKSALLKASIGSFESPPIYIDEFKKKQTLIKIILSTQNIEDPDVYKEAERQMKKLPIEELLDEIEQLHRTVIIDDVTELSRSDRKIIAKLAQITTVAASTNRSTDKKLFATYVEIKPLKRHHTRMILSDMIQMTDPHQKECVVDDILHTAGDNLKEAEYIARQMQLGKNTQEITTEERTSNQVSIAPLLTLVVLFFIAYVLKSYATSMVAFSYALLVVFRMVFYRYIFTPAISKKKT
ncbi:MAG: ATP-binding protein, partial [Spirochaetota bacterium]